jgi:gliding motility-associated-like protein
MINFYIINSVNAGRQYLLFALLLLCPLLGFSQNETDNWYFGQQAGLNFSDGNFSILTDGAMNTPAGCSAISDFEGNLLFYTNGATIWNKNHAIMTNGEGLIGEIEMVQTSIIVPNPQNENIYYVFTIRENTVVNPDSFNSGLYFSEVTFSAEHPLGVVTQKNEFLSAYVTGRLTAIHHYENNSIEVISFGSIGLPRVNNTFFMFNVTGAGVNTTPVRATIPQSLSANGQMKISPDGSLIALTDSENQFVYVFNHYIGAISYRNVVSAYDFFVDREPYGIEFSADSRHLYFTTKTLGTSLSSIWQFDVFSDNEVVSKNLVNETTYSSYGSLQLARNGKIYVAKTGVSNRNPPLGINSIDVINFPEKRPEECGYEENIGLLNKRSQHGLPAFITSFFRNRIITEDKCIGEVFNFDIDAYVPVVNATWDFDDGNQSQEVSPSHSFTASGTYNVKATIIVNGHPVSLYKEVKVHALPQLESNTILKQCDPENDGVAYFNLNTVNDKIINQDDTYTFKFYHSLADAQAETNEIETPGLYQNISNPEQVFVTITNQYGCVNSYDFYIEAVFKTLAPLAPIYVCDESDTIVNNGEGSFDLIAVRPEIIRLLGLPTESIITLYANFQDAQTKTNELDDTFITAATTIWVRIDDESYDCNGIGTLQLLVAPPITLDIEDQYTLCDLRGSNTMVIDGGAEYTRWEWKRVFQDVLVSTQRQFTLTQPGRFSLTVYREVNGIICSATKMFVVLEQGSVVFNEVTAQDGQISVSVTGRSSYEFSLDGRVFTGSGTSHVFLNVDSGSYTIYVRDAEGCELPISKDVILINFDKFFTPNGDGENDLWRLRNVNTFFKDVTIYIYNRYGKLLHSINTRDNRYGGWDGTFKGSPLPASDYWFTAVMVDNENKVYSKQGHFSLLR